MVRNYTGWRRYDTEEELQILEKLTLLIGIRHNLYLPQMKLVERVRIGGKIKKIYEMDTPVHRVLKLDIVSEQTKQNLRELRQKIDIVKLSKAIEQLIEQLDKAYENKIRRTQYV